MGFLLFAAAAPSPMYMIYQARWHFSATTLTLVFAVYALAVLAALIGFGALSDHLGRRPVLMGSLLVQITAMALFAIADSVAWLYAARIVQGLATGAASGVLGAALIDLAPPQRPSWGPLVNTVSLTAGMGLGALITAALVQFAPAPTVLIYLLLLVVFVLAIIGSWMIPEPVSSRWSGWRQTLHPRRPSVPASARWPFALASTGLVAAFAISGLYLSLGPSVAAALLHSRNHLIGGLLIFALFGTGAAAQLSLRHWQATHSVRIGSVATVGGSVLTAYSVSAPSPVAIFAGSAVLGCGFGLSLMGAFRTAASLAGGGRRAELTSATYVVIYLSLSVPAILAGLGATHLGLRNTILIFNAVLIVLAVLAGAGTMTQHGSAPDKHQTPT